MKLFLIHVGYYDSQVMEGLYEQHANFFVVAKNKTIAKKKAQLKNIFKEKKMHIDGIQELNTIDGYDIELTKANKNNSIATYNYQEVKKIK